jgi:ATP-dependent Lon protease
LVTIEASGYNIKQKVKIATGHMLPAIYKDFGINSSIFKFSDEILEYIITKVTDEKGVRNLQRGLEHIIGQANLHRLLKKPPLEFPLEVTKEVVDMFLKSKKTADWPNSHIYL